MPDVEEIFLNFQGKKFFSELDLSAGYWQIPLSDRAKCLTAFSTPQGHFQFTVMPFGCQGGPSTFSRLMRRLLQGCPNTQNFMDNVIVASDTWEEHLAALETVIRKCQTNNLHLRPTKCHLGYPQIDCLGFVVNGNDLMPQDEKIAAIRNARPPKTKKQVRAFIGLANFYRRFCPNFSDLTAPLSDLTKRGMPNTVQWTEQHQLSFDKLKQLLTSKPVLRLPDLTKPYVLSTDASTRASGSCLSQYHDGIKRAIAYASKKFSPTEQRYSTVERECLAIVRGIEKFSRYLYGTKFGIETDHAPLRFLSQANLTNPRLLRWTLALQPYVFDIKHIKGQENHAADYLSRTEYDTV